MLSELKSYVTFTMYNITRFITDGENLDFRMIRETFSSAFAVFLHVGSADCEECPEFCAEQPDAKGYLLLLWEVVRGSHHLFTMSI